MTGVLFVIGACFVWALDTLIRYPLIGQGVPAEAIVFTEHIILSLIFIPMMIKDRANLWNARVSHVFYFMIIGGFGSALATLCFTRAFALINPSLVIILQKLQPIVAILLARMVLKEPIKKQYLLWAGLCLVGGFMISFRDMAPGMSDFFAGNFTMKKGALLGYVLTLVAVLGWGSSTVFGKKLALEGYSEKQLMGGRFVFGLIFLLPLATRPVPVLPDGMHSMLKILIMVLISGLLGMWLYYQGLRRISARLCALAEMFFPFCAIAVNWVFLDATLEPIQLVGGGLLLAGSTIIQLKHY